MSTDADRLADLSALFAKKGEFVTRLIASETILVPVRGCVGDLDSIFNLSEVASVIWNRLDGKTSVGQIVDDICAEFAVPPGTAAADALAFIADVQRAGLVEPAPETTA